MAVEQTPLPSHGLSAVGLASSGAAGSGPSQPNRPTLSDEEQKVVDALKSRDAHVRRHEQAHRLTGGQLVRGATQFTYQEGPVALSIAIY